MEEKFSFFCFSSLPAIRRADPLRIKSVYNNSFCVSIQKETYQCRSLYSEEVILWNDSLLSSPRKTIEYESISERSAGQFQ